jgi:hypothetical protein
LDLFRADKVLRDEEQRVRQGQARRARVGAKEVLRKLQRRLTLYIFLFLFYFAGVKVATCNLMGSVDTFSKFSLARNSEQSIDVYSLGGLLAFSRISDSKLPKPPAAATANFIRLYNLQRFGRASGRRVT